MRLLEFYERFRPPSYGTNWHHKLICRELERAYERRQNLIIECPPRHGKSELANIYGPAWWLLTHPDERFGLVTNSDALAKKFSVACQNLILSVEYQKIRRYKLVTARDNEWKIKSPNTEIDFTYKAASIDGQLTGHGFSTLMFDDLIKSGRDAKSDTKRENIWENVCSAAINRLTPTGIVVAMGARLHIDDPIGRLLTSEEAL
jgi:hypothetical protein